MEFFLFWIVFCGIAGAIAQRKGRSGVGFCLLSIVISPLLGILIALVVQPDTGAIEKAKLVGGDGKLCPYCAEVIKPQATVCRYCGRDMPMRTAVGSHVQRITGSSPSSAALALPASGAAAYFDERAPSARDRLKELYLLSGGEQRGPYSRTQLQEMWNAGDLNDQSLYWKDGLPDWRPVLEII